MVMENPEIGRQLKEHANAIRSAGKRAIRDVIEVGRHLTEAKALVGHGGWNASSAGRIRPPATSCRCIKRR
jgi:Protein of unknown function (DUF3102)